MRALGIPVTLGTIAAVSCFCCGDGTRKFVVDLIPVLEKLDPDAFPPPVDCDEDFPAPAPNGCTVGRLTCGSVIEANNSNGAKNWDDRFYNQFFCTPGMHGYDAGRELAWMLELPANTRAEVTLISECADLDLVALTWSDERTCPSKSVTSVAACEMDTSRGGGSVVLTTVGNPIKFLVGVDGKEGATGNFRIEVECGPYR